MHEKPEKSPPQSASRDEAAGALHVESPRRSVAGRDQERIDELRRIDEAILRSTEPPDGDAMNTARAALAALPPLSDEAVREIKARIETGYYRQPKVVELISERLRKDGIDAASPTRSVPPPDTA